MALDVKHQLKGRELRRWRRFMVGYRIRRAGRAIRNLWQSLWRWLHVH